MSNFNIQDRKPLSKTTKEGNLIRTDRGYSRFEGRLIKFRQTLLQRNWLRNPTEPQEAASDLHCLVPPGSNDRNYFMRTDSELTSGVLIEVLEPFDSTNLIDSINYCCLLTGNDLMVFTSCLFSATNPLSSLLRFST